MPQHMRWHLPVPSLTTAPTQGLPRLPPPVEPPGPRPTTPKPQRVLLRRSHLTPRHLTPRQRQPWHRPVCQPGGPAGSKPPEGCLFNGPVSQQSPLQTATPGPEHCPQHRRPFLPLPTVSRRALSSRRPPAGRGEQVLQDRPCGCPGTAPQPPRRPPPGGAWAPKALRGLPTLPPQPNGHAPDLMSAVSVACTPCPHLSAARSKSRPLRPRPPSPAGPEGDSALVIGPCRPHRPSPWQTHRPRAESPRPWMAGQAAGKHLVVNETLCEPGARTQLQDIKPRTEGPIKKHGLCFCYEVSLVFVGYSQGTRAHPHRKDTCY
nr:proline-rich protein HaeIII subfamily 1-like [Vulpes vulpes]